MKQKNLLNKFDYKTYDPVYAMDNQIQKVKSGNRPPFLKVRIDFESGSLVLDADRQFLSKNTQNTKQKYFQVQEKQVHMQMYLVPAVVIDLNDRSNNGRLFSLEGIIVDETLVNSCIGMLILKYIRHKERHDNLWLLEFSIYDNSTYYGEIKFDLPIYLANEGQEN